MDLDEILQKYLSNYSYHFQIPTISFIKKIRLRGEVDPIDIKKYLLINNKNLQYLSMEDSEFDIHISDEEMNCINYLIDKQDFCVEEIFISHEKKEATLQSLQQILIPILSDDTRLENVLLQLIPKLASWKHRTVISLKHPSLSWLVKYNEKLHSETIVHSKTKSSSHQDPLIQEMNPHLSTLQLQEKYIILSKLFEMIKEVHGKHHLFLRRKSEIVHSQQFQSSVIAWWNKCTKGGDKLDKRHYFYLFMAIYQHLVLNSIRPYQTIKTPSHSKPLPISFFDAYSAVEQDWLVETGGVLDQIQKDNFFVSLFELADTWCEEKTTSAFCTFLNSLLDRVFSVSDYHLQVDKLTNYLTPKTPKQVNIGALPNDVPNYNALTGSPTTPKRNVLPFGEEQWSFLTNDSPKSNNSSPEKPKIVDETLQRLLSTPLKRVNSSRHLVHAIHHLESSPAHSPRQKLSPVSACNESPRIPLSPTKQSSPEKLQHNSFLQNYVWS